MMTRLAATRLMPREPARVEMRNKRPLGEYKRVEEREREWGVTKNYVIQDYCMFSIPLAVRCIMKASKFCAVRQNYFY